MVNLTKNEMSFVLTALKNPELEYNANSISKHLKLSSMGALKIARKLEKEGIIISRELGKAKFYKLNFSNDYARRYITFLLNMEAEESKPYVKRWVNELKRIKNAEAAVLFGSVLTNEDKAQDVDVLLIIKKTKFQKLKKELRDINLINKPKIHPLYQTCKDFKTNLRNKDKIILNAIKGIFVIGEDKIMELLEK